MIENTEDIP